MLRFLAPRPQVDPVHDRLLEVVEQHRAKSKTRKACKVPAWAKWPMDKKLEAVKFYSLHGYRALRLKYSQTPPSSTVRYASYSNPYLCTFSFFFLQDLAGPTAAEGHYPPSRKTPVVGLCRGEGGT